ncbi:1-(5-phosphoribosyl)-5-[(5-phosphoribosylamino)methylideneamino]imidazole-4-carboxamide isomerase [Texcoconibacillus texcoconensis]|uniref:1-(5-phosphoribosyl)-5-[(5-phosphoribosylamino)methylideneamino] imidazole-4-carboxamide isomerase n=1 Tax=Texcoconibacillus texcoconensis TaxID=1095777 RepID=A0A840QPZ7_9BACI|nr:phosphoribosylformimino-5-aminoimidazole carboxamide ribotide isomerase [Texcoconibacillus texcoconensis]
MFNVYPAIDIRGGKCVRLMQGDYDRETVYGDSPQAMAERFVDEGASWIHLVDLDGAKEGKPVNDAYVLDVAKNLPVRVQVGGGIRTEEDAARYLENGVDRIILGSSAVSDPDFVKAMLARFGGERVAIGIDARDGFVATEGWLETSEVRAETLGEELVKHGAEVFITTDISRDGMLSGPNVEAIARLAEVTGKEVIASGGVSQLSDLKELNAKQSVGVAGAIVGKALYTDQFSLSDALREVE